MKKKGDKKQIDYLASWKRERADFLNYKKDESQRLRGSIEMIKEDMILELLPILDNIILAEKELPEDSNWTKGFLGIKAQVIDFLKKEGVEEIDCLDKKFDPHLHEAVEQIEGEESGIIVEIIQKGYNLNNKVLRPAKVKVTK